jgi:hypothetical protein
MAIAADILNETFQKTKQQFFPIKAKYWLRMGIVSLFTGRGSSSYNGSSGSSGRDYPNMNFNEVISKFNTEALAFLSQYGFIVGLGFVFLYAISLFFSYIASVLNFVWIEGVLDKNFKILNSFKKNNKIGVSFFFLKFILGLIGLILMLLIFSPLILSFFNNNLVNFNWWLLIPMFLALIFVGFIMGIFWFLVYDFVLPVMYMKQWPFLPAWKYFVKIGRKKKMEIFLYWLIKLGLGMAVAFASLLILILPLILVMALVIGVGVALYLLMNSIAGMTTAIIVTGIIMFFIMIFLSLLLAVVFVPIPAFFTRYSIEMDKKLESAHKV